MTDTLQLVTQDMLDAARDEFQNHYDGFNHDAALKAAIGAALAASGREADVPGLTIALLVFAGHVTQEQVDAARSVATSTLHPDDIRTVTQEGSDRG